MFVFFTMFKRLNGKLEGNASNPFSTAHRFTSFSYVFPLVLESPQTWILDMDVSKNRGKPPKWMVKIMENPMNKWMIWGVPLFLV